MSDIDISLALRRRPFEPFRIQVSDGTTYEIRHPELVMVGLSAVNIGIQAAGKAYPVYERMETISLTHVIKLLPLDSQVAGKS